MTYWTDKMTFLIPIFPYQLLDIFSNTRLRMFGTKENV